MAEVIGVVASGITITGLFKVCLDAIDMIQTAQHQDLDVKKLVLKLNIEKCRLYAWGEAIGLTTTSVAGQPRPLDACSSHIQELIKDTLNMTICLFTDTLRLKDRYGCNEIPPNEALGPVPTHRNNFGPIDKLANSFGQFKVANRSPDNLARLVLKARWVIRDRKKFMELVAEVREFVNGLQDLTQSIQPAMRQENAVRRCVQQTNDVETLDLIADVCELDHPAIADAASERSTILSLAPPHLLEIEQWISDVVPEPEGELAELGSLFTTERKHRLLAYDYEHTPAKAQTNSDPNFDEYLLEKAQEQAIAQRNFSTMSFFFIPAAFISSFFALDIQQVFSISTHKLWVVFGLIMPLCASIMVITLWGQSEIRLLRRRRGHGPHVEKR